MKKLFLLGFLFIATQSFSQNWGKLLDRLHFGLKAGANYSDFTGADFDTKGLTGFHTGALVAIDLSKRFSIQEEFLYSLQGATRKGGMQDGQDYKLTYLSVPIVLKYRMPIGLFFEAGPQIGLLIDEKIPSWNSGDFAEKIDGGLTAGIGYQMENGLGINARYFRSFTDVTKVKTPGLSTNFQNNSFQMSLFYIF